MPFYEYTCTRCGCHHEELQKVTDSPLRKCPACGRNTLRRIVSAPVFRLKGGGWYETDFKGEQDSKRNLAGEREAAADAAPADKLDKPEKADKADKPEKADKAGTPAKAAAPKPKARPKALAPKPKPKARKTAAK